MQAFTIHQGIAVPLDSANVDTDQIIHKQFIQPFGFGLSLYLSRARHHYGGHAVSHPPTTDLRRGAAQIFDA